MSGRTFTDFGAALGTLTSSALTATQKATVSAHLVGTAGITIAANGNTTANAGSDTGHFVLSGDNTSLTGGITITSGLVSFANSSAAGSAASTAGSGNAITLSGGGIFATTSLALGNTVALAASTTNTLRAAASTTLTLNGAVSGSGILRNNGTVLLNNYSGTGNIAAGAGKITFAQAGALTLNQAISGSVDFTGGGVYTLGGTTNSGTYQITNGGTLKVRGAETGGLTLVADSTSSIETTESQTSNFGPTYRINGAGVAATSGIKLVSGGTTRGFIDVITGPTTIRSSGPGVATFIGSPDALITHLVTSAAASGTVIDSLVNLSGGSSGTFPTLIVKTAVGANTANGDLIVNGALTGNSQIWFGKYSSLNNNADAVGSVLLNAAALPTGSGFGVGLSGGTLRIGHDNALGAAAILSLSVGSFTSCDTKLATHNGARSIGNTILLTINDAAFTVDTAAGNLTLSGELASRSNAGAATTGTKLIKTGANKLILSNANTSFAGTVQIDQGSIVTANTSALGTGATAITVATAGTLEIGNGTTHSVVLGSGATLVINGTLKFTSASSAIALQGAGGYTLGDGSFIDLNNQFNTIGTFNLITGGSGTKTDGTFGFVGNSATLDYSFSQGVLTVAIPEPSTYGLIGAASLAACALIRRRRKSAV